jgi:hypothetical protein
MSGTAPRLTPRLDMLPRGVLLGKDLLPMDYETTKKEARERGSRAIDLIALAPPIERYFDTTLGSREREAYRALTAALENQQQAVVDTYREEIETLQAEHVQLAQAFEQQMQALQARLVALWQVIEHDLEAVTPTLEDCPLPVAYDGNERPDSLYTSERGYAEQLGAYKAFQGKTAEMPRMEDES